MSAITTKLSWAEIARRGTHQKNACEVAPARADEEVAVFSETPSGTSAAIPAITAVDSTALVEEETEAEDESEGGEEEDEASASGSEARTPLARTPGARGEKQCWCRGELLVMLGHYGWILSLDDIDHPSKDQNGGRIYVHKRDIVGRAALRAGDVVGFYLYVDNQGLGAEACRLEESPSKRSSEDGDLSDVSTDAPASGNEAVERVASRTSCAHDFNVNAKEFVPSAGQVANNTCFQVMIDSMINPIYLLDDSDSDEESDIGNEADKESCSDGSQTSPEDAIWDADLKTAILHAPWNSRRSETSSQVVFRAPPGLSLPAGVSPPPGLGSPPGL